MIKGIHSALEYLDCSPVELDRKIALLKSMNVQVSRNSFLWYKIEHEQGNRDWSYPDLFVSKLLSAGIEPLMTIFTSPRWCNDDDFPDYVPTDESKFQVWLCQYRDFVTELATRYKGIVKYYELWNEPNVDAFWAPSPNPQQYGRWAQMVYNTIKNINPDAQIAYSSITIPSKAWGGSSKQITGKSFLKTSLMKCGLKPDIVSCHPYANANEAPMHKPYLGGNVFQDVYGVRNTLDSIKMKNTRLWITEFGYQRGNKNITEDLQALYLSQVFNLLKKDSTRIDMFIWFWAEDVPGAFEGFGLIKIDQTLSKAGQVFRDAN